jgi:hypothetical protein
MHFDKWHLGVVRLIDFTAVAVLLIRARSYLKPLSIRPLVLLGQSSLQVFCTHLLFCFAGLTLLGNALMLSGWQQFGLLATTLLAMLLTAKLFAKTELGTDGTHPTPTSKLSYVSVRIREIHLIPAGVPTSKR